MNIDTLSQILEYHPRNHTMYRNLKLTCRWFNEELKTLNNKYILSNIKYSKSGTIVGFYLPDGTRTGFHIEIVPAKPAKIAREQYSSSYVRITFSYYSMGKLISQVNIYDGIGAVCAITQRFSRSIACKISRTCIHLTSNDSWIVHTQDIDTEFSGKNPKELFGILKSMDFRYGGVKN